MASARGERASWRATSAGRNFVGGGCEMRAEWHAQNAARREAMRVAAEHVSLSGGCDNGGDGVAACVFAPDTLPVGGGRCRVVLDALRKRGRGVVELASAGAAIVGLAGRGRGSEGGAGAMVDGRDLGMEMTDSAGGQAEPRLGQRWPFFMRSMFSMFEQVQSASEPPPSTLERLIAADAALMARARSVNEIVVHAINSADILEDGERDVSYKLRTALTTVCNAWMSFLAGAWCAVESCIFVSKSRTCVLWAEAPDIQGRLDDPSPDSTFYGGPTWKDSVRFARWLLTTRDYAGNDPRLMGRTRDSVAVYLKHAMGHLWRALYGGMVQAPAAEWRAYWGLVFQKFNDFFSDEGRERWIREAEADARFAAQHAGGDGAAQDIAAAAARERIKEGLRAATGHPRTRQHATLQVSKVCFEARVHARCVQPRARESRKGCVRRWGMRG